MAENHRINVCRLGTICLIFRKLRNPYAPNLTLWENHSMKTKSFAIAYREFALPLLLFFVLLSACGKHNWEDDEPLPPGPDTGTYQIVCPYDTIRSYPGGGGIFTFGITPSQNFDGDIQLRLFAQEGLSAELNHIAFTKTDTIAELVIAPVPFIQPGLYCIAVEMRHDSTVRTLSLWVWIYDWPGVVSPESSAKLWEFAPWVQNNHPELFAAFGGMLMHYFTYPEVLIVEHHTYLNAGWEIRLCYHVMIPPHDWSMIRIRKLNSLEPALAARRETDGSIHQIGIHEYPLMFGY
jgi:hypothetical protein